MKGRKTSNNRSKVQNSIVGREWMERWREWKFSLGDLRLLNAFLMLKATFSKHWLIKLSWQLSTSSLKFQIWYNRNDCSYKWRLHRVITWKLLFDGEEMKLLIAKDLNLLTGFFWWEKWVTFRLLSPRSPIKV